MNKLPHYRLEARGFDGTAGQEFDNRDYAMRNFDLFARAFADKLGPHDGERLLLLGRDHKVPPPPPDPVGITDAQLADIVADAVAEVRAKAVLGA